MAPYCARSAAKRSSSFLPEIGVSDFAPAELHHGFHAIAFLQKPNRVVFLEIVIVIVGVGAEFQLLHLDDMLLLFGLVLFLFVLILPLAVVHRLGDGRFGSRRDRSGQGLAPAPCDGGRSRHDLDLSIREDRSHFPRADRFIYVFPDPLPAGRKVVGSSRLGGSTLRGRARP